jgi:hypothetical protein|tara:strand:- start:562 stop:1860 length:1299 start_codon:yes stop_codon:yes gene_type:complete
MAHDLYGELLARALQRRAPPGHFPAFVTPGEANLLRSRGGGVAPGGGQFMAGGIPAFAYGSEAGFGQGEGEPGDPTGFGGVAGPGMGFGGMTGEFGGMGFDAFGFSPEDQGDHGSSFTDQLESFLASRAKTDTIAERGTESAFEEAQETHEPYSGDTTDQGAEAQQAALAMAQHEVNTGRMSQEEAFSALESPIDRGGLGRFSPAVGWGINSETGLASFADLAALNAQDHTGYAINNPQPTEASILASQVFGRLNPSITNAVIGLAGFLPGPIGLVGTLAGMIENKGLLSIPAVQSIPGIGAISEGLASARGKIGDVIGGITDPITGPVGQALSAGQQALANALSGIPGLEESAGFDDAGDFDGGGVDGGAPNIDMVPPIATQEDVDPIMATGTFADVDAATRNRILANIISGLERTDRPTAGATAFGPLFV